MGSLRLACEAMGVHVGVKRSRRRGARIALGVAVLAVLALVLAQAILPTVVANRVRDHVSRYGSVKSASVSAWPAIELLWGKADSAKLSAGSLSATPAQLAALLWEANGVNDMTMTAEEMTLRGAGPLNGLTLRNVRTEKRGAQITESGTFTQQQLDEALPGGFRVQLVASGGGQVQVRASGGLFGAQMSIPALLKPLEGRLVVEPQGFPLAGLATVTLLSDPHLKVQSIAVAVIGRQPLTYRLSLGASLS